MTTANAPSWHYAAGNQTVGPVAAEQMMSLIKTGIVNANTMVWSRDLTDWRRLGETEFAAAMAQPSDQDNAGEIGGAKPVGFGEAISRGFAKTFEFYGRASRSEFWYLQLFLLLAGFAAGFADGVLFGPAPDIAPLSLIVGLGTIFTSIAVSIRRLHDTDRTGWWLLISLIPLVGLIVLIVFYCQRGTEGLNRFAA